MKFLLLQSPDDFNNPVRSTNLPLSFGIIVSYLRKNNINVKAYDLNESISKECFKVSRDEWLKVYSKEFVSDCLNSRDKSEKVSNLYQHILEEINIDEYDFVGISMGSYGSFFEIHTSFLLGKLIQTKYNKPVVFGGINVGFVLSSDLYDEVVKLFLKNFKYVIMGPGERSLVKLLQSYENGSIDTVSLTLSGAAYISDGDVIANEPDSPTFTCPDYSDLNLGFYKTYFAGTDEDEHVKQYYKTAFPFYMEISDFVMKNFPDTCYPVNIIPYFFNQNCPFHCTFCAQSLITAKPITKDIDEIVNDISFLQKQYNSKYFQFLNNAINYTPAFVRDFCTKIIDKGIKIYWSDCARVNGLTKELVDLMYKAGCRKLIFGFETGSEKMLKYINKKLDLDQVSKVLKWCGETGIYSELEVIVGLPYEFDEDFEATYSFLQKNIKHINCIHPAKYYVLRHTLLERYPEKFDIELIKHESYESMLSWVERLSMNNFRPDQKDLGKTLFHVQKFNEINGRPHEIIEKETHIKYLKCLKLNLQLPGFTEKNNIIKELKNGVIFN